ncbi:hypothetical protein BLNAU_21466 [Blattamonas nauphoetae]|uniref:Uncharacterized protein n=1 Tax=Blattamonas nauphoetae TaxID=2049346 RepID=A0ABQ9WVW9_9EUKA|nr:hypothetical protein BLNAU_21466 [Blattamonas nauphoetae]
MRTLPPTPASRYPTNITILCPCQFHTDFRHFALCTDQNRLNAPLTDEEASTTTQHAEKVQMKQPIRLIAASGIGSKDHLTSPTQADSPLSHIFITAFFSTEEKAKHVNGFFPFDGSSEAQWKRSDICTQCRNGRFHSQGQ